jgi:hypothetical protein
MLRRWKSWLVEFGWLLGFIVGEVDAVVAM